MKEINIFRLLGVSSVILLITGGILRFVYDTKFSDMESWLVLLLMVVSCFSGYSIRALYHKEAST